MSHNSCRNVDQLAVEGKWDDVFHCLHVEPGSFTLTNWRFKKPNLDFDYDDSWIVKQIAINNSLEVILAIILVFDQIVYVALLWYMLLFAFFYLRHRVFDRIKKLKIFHDNRTMKTIRQCVGNIRRRRAEQNNMGGGDADILQIYPHNDVVA